MTLANFFPYNKTQYEVQKVQYLRRDIILFGNLACSNLFGETDYMNVEEGNSPETVFICPVALQNTDWEHTVGMEALTRDVSIGECNW